MRESESKAPLALMEQVIMVLVFALAAALCIQAFVLARTISIRLTERDHAINLCQTLAETVKAYGGSPEKIIEELGGGMSGEQIVFYYDSDWMPLSEAKKADYRVVFEKEERENSCQYGRITVSDTEKDNEIYSMRIAWQEGEADE